jgi:hypothetical protein
MPYETDQRLKSFLDGNQVLREQLCAAILTVDPRFSNVRPQHPRGGPDGGSDVTATFKDGLRACIAVGFVNQATDSSEHRRAAAKKFEVDLRRAMARTPPPQAFVFFSNVSITSTKKRRLVELGMRLSLSHCEIVDREQMRLVLDSADGLAIRYQYLGLSMSDAEQAVFFGKWGANISRVISEQFGRTQSLLSRIEFLHESSHPIRRFRILLEFGREVRLDALGHISLHAQILLPRPRGTLIGIQFSSVLKEYSISADNLDSSFGFSTSVSEMREEIEEGDISVGSKELKLRLIEDGYLTGIGRSTVSSLEVDAIFESGLLRTTQSPLLLRELGECVCFVFANRSLAKEVVSLRMLTDLYEVAAHDRGEWNLDEYLGKFFPEEGQPIHESDPLVRIYLRYHPFYFDFGGFTPRRLGNAFDVGPGSMRGREE